MSDTTRTIGFAVCALFGLTVLGACTSEPSHGVDTTSVTTLRDTNAATVDTTRAVPYAELVAVLRDTLRARNPNIDSVSVFEGKSTAGGDSPKLFIGYGVRGDFDFKGSFEDELYVVFVANDSLNRILRILDIIPTPRWRDYSLHISALTPDSVTIEGAGATYEDQPLRRSYKLR